MKTRRPKRYQVLRGDGYVQRETNNRRDAFSAAVVADTCGPRARVLERRYRGDGHVMQRECWPRIGQWAPVG
jgi:hypothetical protein